MYKRVLGRYRLQQGLLRSQHKTPRGSRNAFLSMRLEKTTWVGGQKREAMRKEEGSELITY